MILNNMAAGNDDDSREETGSNHSLLPALTYLAGECPLITPLPAAPDDRFPLHLPQKAASSVARLEICD
jgi:hypothetical protein